MIVDIRHKPSAEDRVMVEFLLGTDYDFLICASKADQAVQNRRAAELRP